MRKQSENKSGKPELDKVANTPEELAKINSLIAKMALPRGIVTNETSRALAVGAGRTLADRGRICDQPRRQDRGSGRGRRIVGRRTPGAGRMRSLHALRRDGGARYGRGR